MALGWLNVIMNEGLYDQEFVTKWCMGFDDLKKRVDEYPLPRVEKITGVPADDLQGIAAGLNHFAWFLQICL
jgi:anaerobic selenocysteine-containing dehydrogenase